MFGFLFYFYLFFRNQSISQSLSIGKRRGDTRLDPGTELINLEHKFSTFGSINPEKICWPEIIGWARDQVSYSIDWIKLEVENTSFTSPGWDVLDDVLSKKYGDFNILMAFVDSGYMTDREYAFCSRYENAVVPCKGGSKFTGKNAYKMSEIAGQDNMHLAVLAGDYYKDKLFGWLNQEKKDDIIPYGYCFYPNDYEDEFFRGYENEIKLEVTDRFGKVLGHKWERRTNKAFNEPWDCRVYAMVALDLLVDRVRVEEDPDDEGFSIDDFFDYIESANA